MSGAREQTHSAGWKPAVVALLLAISGIAVAQAAADSAAATKTAAVATPAARQPKPGSVPVSPYVRMAREHALAQADAASPGIGVSPYTNRHKPHKPVQAR